MVKWVRRHAALVTATGAVLLAVFASVAGSLVFIAHEQSQVSFRIANAEDQARALERNSRRKSYYGFDLAQIGKVSERLTLSQLEARLNQHWPEEGEEDLRGWEWHYLWALVHPGYWFQAHEPGKAVHRLVFSSDGTQLVSTSQDGTAKVWDAQTFKLLETLTNHVGDVNAAAFSPDGKWLVTTGDDKTVRLWDRKTFKQVAFWKEHEDEVRFASFLPDSKALVTGDKSGTFIIWDIEKQEERSRKKIQSNSFLYGAALSPRTDRIALATRIESFCTIWRFPFDLSYSWKLNHLGAYIHGVAFTREGDCLATVASDGILRFWRIADSSILWQQPFSRQLRTVAVSPSGELVAATTEDGQLGVFETKDGSPSKSFEALGGGPAYGLVFSPDSSRILVGRADGTIEDLPSHKLSNSNQILSKKAGVNTVAFSPDCHWVLTSTVDNVVKLWDAKSFKFHRILEKPIKSEVQCLAIAPNSRYGAAVCYESTLTVRIWDLLTGNVVQEVKLPNWLLPAGMSFSPDSRLVLIGNGKFEMGIVHIGKGQFRDRRDVRLVCSVKGGILCESKEGQLSILSWKEGGDEPIYKSLSASRGPCASTSVPSMDQIACWGGDLVYFLDLESGRRLKQYLTNDHANILIVRISPDAKTMACVLENRILRIVNLTMDHEMLDIKLPSEFEFINMVFSGDGRTIYTIHKKPGTDYSAFIYQWQTAGWDKVHE